MEQIAKVTSKGQVVIPKKIRDIFNITPQTRVLFSSMGQAITITPVTPVKRLALKSKLAKFEVDANFRKSWEKDLNKRLTKWGW